MACGGGGGPQPGGAVTVYVAYPGASAEEAEARLLVPIESALASVKDLYGMRGRAFEGGASVDVTFRRGVDSMTATHTIREAVQTIRDQLPRMAQFPMVERQPAAWLMARVGDRPQPYTALHADLMRLPIVRVEACGVREARLSLELVPSRMIAMGLTLSDVARTLAEENADVSAGRFQSTDDGEYLVRGQVGSQDAIADLVVGAGGVRVRDVAVITQRSEAECMVEGATDPKLPALVRVGLRSPKDRVAIEKAMKKAKLAPLAGAAAFTAPGRPRKVALVAAPVGSVVEAVLPGDDAGALAEAGRKALEAVRAAPGVAAAWCEGCELESDEKLEIDRDGASARTLVPEEIALALRAATVGEHVSTYREGELEVEVIIGVEEGGARWRELPIRSDDGKIYALGEVVRASKASAPRDLLHVDRRRAVAVWVRGAAKTSAGELTKIVKAALPGPGTRVRTVPPGELAGDAW